MQAFVIGNAALDEIFDVAAFPEPGQSIFGRTQSVGLGGKGANQAVMLGRAGVPTALIAPIGEDARGAAVRQALAAEPVRLMAMDSGGAATDTSIIMRSANGENTIVTTREAALSIRAEASDAFATARTGDWVVLQGNLSIETTGAILREAKARGQSTALNPSPLGSGYADLWPLVDVVFVNAGEAEAFDGAAAILSAGAGQVVTTLGGDGSSLTSRTGTGYVPATSSEILDTTGAGDCFMAVALASACLRGLSAVDEYALTAASRAAAITVSRPGTVSAFPTMAEISEILGSD